MSDEIKAGVIVKTKFVTPSSEVFSGYIDYIDRENAVRNEHISSFSVYADYMDNPNKTSDLFTEVSDHLSSKQKDSLKRTYMRAQENGSPMWQTVISFDNRWLEENGLYDSKTKILDTKRLMNYTRNSLNPMLNAEGLENAVWSAAIHYNTDNIHIHIATVEPIPTRQKMIVDGKEEYRGKFKLSSIEKCKSKMVNQIMEQSLDNQKINAIMRDSIIAAMKSNIILEDKDIIEQFLKVYKNLPDDKRAWKYGMNKIANLRPEIDKLTQMWIERYHYDEFNQLGKLLEERQDIYQKAYGDSSHNLYAENKIGDLFKRCGNVILSKMKEMAFRDIRELESSSYISAEVEEAAANHEELNFDGKIKYHKGKSNKYNNEYQNKSKYWTDAFKSARRELADALKLEDETEKKDILERVLSVFNNESVNGNDVASYELGRCYRLGTFGTINLELSHQYYQKAFNGFLNELNSDSWLENMIAASEFGLYNDGLSKQELEKAAAQFARNAERIEWLTNYLNYRVGRMLVDGEGTEKNVQEGMTYLEESNSPFAYFALGNLYYYGNEISQDYEKAYEYFSLAGFPDEGKAMPFALYNMAEMLEKGLIEDVQHNKDDLYKEALYLFMSSEEENPNDLTEYKIASMLISGKGCEVDKEGAKEYLIKSSEYGNTFAQTKLANLYIENGNPQDAQKAIFLLQIAANSDNALAQYQLGKIFIDEKSKYFNSEEGIGLLEKSADHGNDFAEYALGNVFLKGEIIEQDTELALQYLNSSADSGNQFAQYTLGILYLNLNNELIEKDISQAISYLNKSAEQGNEFALYHLGKLYLENEEIKDIDKALEYLTKAEDNENPYLQYSFGKLYLENEDIRDIEKAILYLTASAENDNYYAAYTLGNLYSNNEFIKANYEISEKWYRQAYKGFTAVEQNNDVDTDDSILYNLGIMNYEGLGTEKNIENAINYLIKAAQHDHEYAQYKLGKIYLQGKDVKQNFAYASLWLEKASEKGNQFSQYLLGQTYLENKIVDQDISRSIEYLNKSAQQNNQFAQYQLGKVYYSNEYGHKDIYKALINFKNSADQGNQFAQYQLGIIYYKGDDIEQDPELAINYLEQSAEQGNQFAQYTLGIIYLKGEITAVDINKAVDYFELSAEQNNQFAQYQLGKLYYFGADGITQDRDKAIDYLNRSAAQGNEYAKALLDWQPSSGFSSFGRGMDFNESMISLSSDMRQLFERLADEHDHMLNQMIYQRIEQEKQKDDKNIYQ